MKHLLIVNTFWQHQWKITTCRKFPGLLKNFKSLYFYLTFLYLLIAHSTINLYQMICIYFQWIFLKLFIYLFLFMVVLGLRFCARAFSSRGKRGPLFIAVLRPLTIAASLVAEHRLQMRRLSNCGSRA